MNRPRSRDRNRAGGLLLAVVGLLAAVGVLAGFAVAKDGNHRSEHRHHGHHHHHHHHSGNTGTIASFDAASGKLTISLTDGETISGLVDRGTKIRCEDEHSPDVTQLHHGEVEPGDDHGGHGDEPGDDNGGGNSGPNSSHSGSGPSGHDDNGAGANCTTSALIVGTVVSHAELDLENGSAFFDEVELND